MMGSNPLSKDRDEKQQSLISSALIAEAEVAQKGLVFDADAVFRYIKVKVSGGTHRRPHAIKLNKLI